MKLKTNQSFTKKPRTKIKRIKTEVKIPINKRKTLNVSMVGTNFEGRREKRMKRKEKTTPTTNHATIDNTRHHKKKKMTRHFQ
jgi:hypothetical protein